MPATGSERRSSAVASGMDTSRRLSASSDCSLPDRDRQCFQEHVETIPTRLPKLTSSKPAANPLQFIKVGPCDLYRSAQEQIRKVEEVKKIKEKRDEAEDWQSNLDNWKNSRRKRQEHIIERVVEVKKFELEEYDRNRKRSKTFNEMMEERTNRGRKVSLVVYKDDNDKDLSDLGIGANSGSKGNDSGDSDTQDMIEKEDCNCLERETTQSQDTNCGQDTTVTSQESQEFTYEQAIQSYVNFAETRVKSKNNSRNEQQSIKETNCTSRSEEMLHDVGAKKEKTPPPVAPKPRKYSLKLEEKTSTTDKKNMFAEGNGCISDATRKLSLPQVDVLKRREVFEKSLASKDSSSKSKPAELIDTKTVKERLSCLGINSSGVSNRIKNETEIKTSRQSQLPEPRKQPSEEYVNISDGKLEQNGDNKIVEKSYKNDHECLQETGSEVNSCSVHANDNSVHSMKGQSLSSVTNASTNNKFKMIIDTQTEKNNFCRYDDHISNDRTIETADKCWMQSDNSKNDRWKFHRSLDSLDKKYCDDISSELLERVQSLDGLEHCSSVKDYPLSASSIEMLGSSSNGGDTDREDSGIHTADVSCSISQTDEAAEYGDPSAEMSNTFSHLLLDNKGCNSEVDDVNCIVEEQEFSDFLPPVMKEPIGTADTSRISLENCTSYESEQVLMSGMSTDVSSQSPDSVLSSDSAVLHTEAGNFSSLHGSSACTQIEKGDGSNCFKEVKSEINNCTEFCNSPTAPANYEEFLSDTPREGRGLQPAVSSVGHDDNEMMISDLQSNSVRACVSATENPPDTVVEEQIKALSTQDRQPVHTSENAEQEFKKFEQSSPSLLKSNNCVAHSEIEPTDSSNSCCTEREDTNANTRVFDEPNNAQSPKSLAQFNLRLETAPVERSQDEKAFEGTCMSEDSTPLASTVRGNQHREKFDDIEPEEIMNEESPDRNSHLDTNASEPKSNNMVVVLTEITKDDGNEEDEKREEEKDVLIQKTESNGVDLEHGDGKLNVVPSACINTKDAPSGSKQSKEKIRDPAFGYAQGLTDVAGHDSQKYLTSCLQRNDEVDENVLNERTCVTSMNGLSNTNYEDHSAQKYSDVRENTDKSFLSAEIISKDFKNLRIPESLEVKSDYSGISVAEVRESPMADISQVIHQIPSLNLSSEIEIVAGLTYPLGPVTAAEPPKEKPPPPPPQSDSDEEQRERGKGLQRIDSTKRIKKEIRRKRTNFLGIEGNADDSYLEPELKVAPPPDMTTFLIEEQRLQKQLYRQSICSESDSNLGETTDSRDSGVELEKGNPDDIWAPKPSSSPDVLSEEHSRQNSEIYGNASIASEDDEIAKKEREIIEILEKEEQWQHGHSPHNHEENIGEELTEKLWQLEQDNLRFEWEKEAQRRELEETVQRCEEEMRQKEREIEFQQHEAMLQMERIRLEGKAEVIARHSDKLSQPQQWGNKGRLSLQDISVMRQLPPKNTTQLSSRSILPEHCQSMPNLQQKRPEQEWKQHNPGKFVSTHHSQSVQQDCQEKENYNRSSWTPAFSPITQQQKDFPAPGSNHIQGQQMTRQTLQALSAVPRPRLIPTENWIQAKRKPESKRGTFNSQHWLIQEAEQRRITEQLQRNAMTSQKMPTSQLSQPLHWMHQQPQQKKPLPDSVINTLTQRVQSKVDNKKYPNRTRVQDIQSREQVVGHHNMPRSNGNPGTLNCDQTTEKMLSVSGKKKCSHCGEELGRGAAMIIESLRLFYHIDCFKCCVCHIQLGDGLMGTDVRVRNNKLHCHNCYSSEDGVKFSCV